MSASVLDMYHLARQTEYPAEAFAFLQRGLDFAVRRVHGEPDAAKTRESRHISGQQLCQGLRDYALQQYGLLARTVLKHWNVHTSEDFGHIVFSMVKAGLMQKTANDCLGDFVGALDFSAAFRPDFELAASPAA